MTGLYLLFSLVAALWVCYYLFYFLPPDERG